MTQSNKYPAEGLKNAMGSHRKVTIIRHGATSLNNDDVSIDRIRGWQNVPLSKSGASEANRLGKELKKNPPDKLITSDLDRASETAEIISKHTGAPVVEKTRALRPWNVGDYTGQTTEKALPVLTHHMEHSDKEVPGGESFNDFKNRFLGGVHKILKKHSGNVALVTHHRGERLLEAWKKKGFPADGDIDLKTFNQKGNPTASQQTMDIPT